MIQAIALDDEPLALQVLEVFCNSLSTISLNKTFTNVSDVTNYLKENEIDVIFLDIEMPKINGVDFYKSLQTDIQVIFTTAYDSYAVEGFNVKATDYLLKPYSIERFSEAIKRVQEQIDFRKATIQERFLQIKADYKQYQINHNAILYIEAMDDYVKIHRKNDKTLVTRSTMKGMLLKIANSNFVRIHKSYIIPKNKIKNFNTQEVDLGYIQLPIGNSYRKELHS